METTEQIFTGTPESARSLARALERRAIPCFVEDQRRFSAHSGSAVVTHSWLLVAPEDVERAELERDSWAAGAERRADTAIRRVAVVVGLGSLAPLAWVLAALVMPERVEMPHPYGLLGVWFVSLVVVGQLENRRHQVERIAPPPGHGLQ